ncbi:unnamed protein product [Cuscuta europaea]|uniref:Aminoacyl-tRNA synthetase class II (D/K/N) domain-containing protein n=1 Tax=Cuscuta europaea TaxID=41803 RepID=A0A9P0YT39_CUSEU|nr:unnamed protein product [Cuscuta europaea]
MSLSEPAVTARTNKYTNRVILKTILERSDGGLGFVGQRMVIGGWVKSSREIKKETVLPLAAGTKDVSCGEVLSRFPLLRSIFKAFRGDGDSRVHDKPDDVQKPLPPPSLTILKVSDGSSLHRLLVLVDSELAIPSQVIPAGTCIVAEGILQQPASLGKHLIEFKADKVLHLGTVDQMKYPLSKKGLSMEFLWDWSHLRARTTTVASIMRIRDAMNQAFHTFFRENEFLYVHMPTMTSTNTSEYRKKFVVTTLVETDNYDGMDTLEHITASIKEKSKLIEKLERSESNNEALVAAKMDLEIMKKVISRLGSKMHLTASGRLHLESHACALGNVYTSGPRFQEKKSESKSLPEMLVVETEMAFSKLEDAMNCADDLLKFICKSVLENSTADVNFLSKRSNKSITVMEHLNFITSCSLKRVSYTAAVNDLKLATEKKFGKPVEWGVRLSDEHTSYLVDEIYKGPIFIYNHPKNLKPFNVRLNDDAKTVASFDIILPKVGILISGSQSEERLKTLSTRMEEVGLPKQQYEWYLDLRRHGTVEHSGFSVMFDSFVLFATGLNDIRDVVPFPVRSSKTREGSSKR